MDLTHRFTVPTSVDETWAHFQDIASVAECFPGASVTSIGDDTFQGSCKVKLGPIALVYNGSGTFVEKDEAAHSFVVAAKGKDKRGNGTAGATVRLSMAGSAGAARSTDVEVVTDLSITGKPAQFGRGVMQDVSDKLLGQFVACLEQRLSGEEGSGSAPDPAPTGAGSASADPPASTPANVPGKHAATTAPAATTGPTMPTRSTGRPVPDDALDLGTAVLPILAKTYWKQAAAGMTAVAVVIWLVRRR